MWGASYRRAAATCVFNGGLNMPFGFVCGAGCHISGPGNEISHGGRLCHGPWWCECYPDAWGPGLRCVSLCILVGPATSASSRCCWRGAAANFAYKWQILRKTQARRINSLNESYKTVHIYVPPVHNMFDFVSISTAPHSRSNHQHVNTFTPHWLAPRHWIAIRAMTDTL